MEIFQMISEVSFVIGFGFRLCFINFTIIIIFIIIINSNYM